MTGDRCAIYANAQNRDIDMGPVGGMAVAATLVRLTTLQDISIT
jgi:hypothetical protein